MKKLIGLGAVVVAVALGGCGVVAKVNARNDTEHSLATYKSCLQAHATAPQSCDAKKMAYQADLQTYRAFSAGILPRQPNETNVTVSATAR